MTTIGLDTVNSAIAYVVERRAPATGRPTGLGAHPRRDLCTLLVAPVALSQI